MRKSSLFLFLLLVIFNQAALSQQDQDLPEGTMAIRGDGSVTREMFDARMSRIPEKDRTGVLRSSERLQKILADLLLTSQLAADAKAAGFDKGDIQYRMQLAAEQELSNAWLNHYVDMQPEADYTAMAHEFYLLNKDKMMTPPSRDVTHLLVSTKDLSQEEAEARASSFLEQVKSDPAIFDELVVQVSEDPSMSQNKGHFPGVKRGDMVKPFEDALFSLQAPGDFSGLVHTRFGIHILRLDKINSPRKMEFKEVQKRLETNQVKAHKERVRNTYLSELGSSEWNVSEEEIKAMVERYFDEDELRDDSKEPESE